ncbi:MAG: hypothetical protein K1X55_00385 [Chitinophagales bacterium]|nr:hypothetical protein [Chitinophagales bacterium]
MKTKAIKIIPFLLCMIFSMTENLLGQEQHDNNQVMVRYALWVLQNEHNWDPNLQITHQVYGRFNLTGIGFSTDLRICNSFECNECPNNGVSCVNNSGHCILSPQGSPTPYTAISSFPSCYKGNFSVDIRGNSWDERRGAPCEFKSYVINPDRDFSNFSLAPINFISNNEIEQSFTGTSGWYGSPGRKEDFKILKTPEHNFFSRTSKSAIVSTNIEDDFCPGENIWLDRFFRGGDNVKWWSKNNVNAQWVAIGFDGVDANRYWLNYNSTQYLQDNTDANTKKYTTYTISACGNSTCSNDESENAYYCLEHNIKVYKPLTAIPFEVKKPCNQGNTNNGQVILHLPERDGGWHPDVVNYTYVLQKDYVANNILEAECLTPYQTGCIGNLNSNFTLSGLVEGDYQLTVMASNCNNTTPLRPSLIGCNTLNIIIHIPADDKLPVELGEDKFLCDRNDVVTLSVPPTYTQNGNQTAWFWECDDNFISNADHIDVHDGLGGFYRVEVTNSSGCTTKDRVFIADFNKPRTMKASIPDALQTSASQLTSNWYPEVNAMNFNTVGDLNNFLDKSRFANGKAGIFRGNFAYDYLDARELTTGIKTQHDGAFGEYYYFNWHDPNYTECVPEWKYNAQMTKYNSSGFDIENKDILGRYSAELYGYKDRLVIASAANARYNEIAFEGFEEYKPFPSSYNQLTNSTGNFDLVQTIEPGDYPYYEVYPIKYGFGRYAYTPADLTNVCSQPVRLEIYAKNVPMDISTPIDERFNISQNTIASTPICGESKGTFLTLDEGVPGFDCEYWTGDVTIKKFKSVPEKISTTLIYVKTEAHTGKMSAKVIASGDPESVLSIPQTALSLDHNKTYYISAWVRIPDMDNKHPDELKQFYHDNNIRISVEYPGMNAKSFYPSGNVIDGWQRIEGTFTTSAKDGELKMKFDNVQDFYLDDIRLTPENSSIQTYVYDPQTYRLIAVLDQNNYAAIYQYDDQGQLFLTKKETTEGIKTIQLNSSYIKK